MTVILHDCLVWRYRIRNKVYKKLSRPLLVKEEEALEYKDRFIIMDETFDFAQYLSYCSQFITR